MFTPFLYSRLFLHYSDIFKDIKPLFEEAIEATTFLDLQSVVDRLIYWENKITPSPELPPLADYANDLTFKQLLANIYTHPLASYKNSPGFPLIQAYVVSKIIRVDRIYYPQLGEYITSMVADALSITSTFFEARSGLFDILYDVPSIRSMLLHIAANPHKYNNDKTIAALSMMLPRAAFPPNFQQVSTPIASQPIKLACIPNPYASTLGYTPRLPPPSSLLLPSQQHYQRRTSRFISPSPLFIIARSLVHSLISSHSSLFSSSKIKRCHDIPLLRHNTNTSHTPTVTVTPNITVIATQPSSSLYQRPQNIVTPLTLSLSNPLRSGLYQSLQSHRHHQNCFMNLSPEQLQPISTIPFLRPVNRALQNILHYPRKSRIAISLLILFSLPLNTNNKLSPRRILDDQQAQLQQAHYAALTSHNMRIASVSSTLSRRRSSWSPSRLSLTHTPSLEPILETTLDAVPIDDDSDDDCDYQFEQHENDDNNNKDTNIIGSRSSSSMDRHSSSYRHHHIVGNGDMTSPTGFTSPLLMVTDNWNLSIPQSVVRLAHDELLISHMYQQQQQQQQTAAQQQHQPHVLHHQLHHRHQNRRSTSRSMSPSIPPPLKSSTSYINPHYRYLGPSHYFPKDDDTPTLSLIYPPRLTHYPSLEQVSRVNLSVQPWYSDYAIFTHVIRRYKDTQSHIPIKSQGKYGRRRTSLRDMLMHAYAKNRMALRRNIITTNTHNAHRNASVAMSNATPVSSSSASSASTSVTSQSTAVPSSTIKVSSRNPQYSSQRGKTPVTQQQPAIKGIESLVTPQLQQNGPTTTPSSSTASMNLSTDTPQQHQQPPAMIATDITAPISPLTPDCTHAIGQVQLCNSRSLDNHNNQQQQPSFRATSEYQSQSCDVVSSSHVFASSSSSTTTTNGGITIHSQQQQRVPQQQQQSSSQGEDQESKQQEQQPLKHKSGRRNKHLRNSSYLINPASLQPPTVKAVPTAPTTTATVTLNTPVGVQPRQPTAQQQVQPPMQQQPQQPLAINIATPSAPFTPVPPRHRPYIHLFFVHFIASQPLLLSTALQIFFPSPHHKNGTNYTFFRCGTGLNMTQSQFTRYARISILTRSLCGHEPLTAGRSLLHVAAMKGYDNVVQMLIDAGYIVDQEDIYGFTPLHCALISAHHTTVALLVREGADISLVRMSKLNMSLFRRGTLECVNALLTGTSTIPHLSSDKYYPQNIVSLVPIFDSPDEVRCLIRYSVESNDHTIFSYCFNLLRSFYGWNQPFLYVPFSLLDVYIIDYVKDIVQYSSDPRFLPLVLNLFHETIQRVDKQLNYCIDNLISCNPSREHDIRDIQRIAPAVIPKSDHLIALPTYGQESLFESTKYIAQLRAEYMTLTPSYLLYLSVKRCNMLTSSLLLYHGASPTYYINDNNYITTSLHYVLNSSQQQHNNNNNNNTLCGQSSLFNVSSPSHRNYGPIFTEFHLRLLLSYPCNILIPDQNNITIIQLLLSTQLLMHTSLYQHYLQLSLYIPYYHYRPPRITSKWEKFSNEKPLMMHSSSFKTLLVNYATQPSLDIYPCYRVADNKTVRGPRGYWQSSLRIPAEPTSNERTVRDNIVDCTKMPWSMRKIVPYNINNGNNHGIVTNITLRQLLSRVSSQPSHMTLGRIAMYGFVPLPINTERALYDGTLLSYNQAYHHTHDHLCRHGCDHLVRFEHYRYNEKRPSPLHPPPPPIVPTGSSVSPFLYENPPPDIAQVVFPRPSRTAIPSELVPSIYSPSSAHCWSASASLESFMATLSSSTASNTTTSTTNNSNNSSSSNNTGLISLGLSLSTAAPSTLAPSSSTASIQHQPLSVAIESLSSSSLSSSTVLSSSSSPATANNAASSSSVISATPPCIFITLLPNILASCDIKPFMPSYHPPTSLSLASSSLPSSSLLGPSISLAQHRQYTPTPPRMIPKTYNVHHFIRQLERQLLTSLSLSSSDSIVYTNIKQSILYINSTYKHPLLENNGIICSSSLLSSSTSSYSPLLSLSPSWWESDEPLDILSNILANISNGSDLYTLCPLTSMPYIRFIVILCQYKNKKCIQFALSILNSILDYNVTPINSNTSHNTSSTSTLSVSSDSQCLVALLTLLTAIQYDDNNTTTNTTTTTDNSNAATNTNDSVKQGQYTPILSSSNPIRSHSPTPHDQDHTTTTTSSYSTDDCTVLTSLAVSRLRHQRLRIHPREKQPHPLQPPILQP